MGVMLCANCHGENIVKLSLVYESGLSHLDLNTFGAGIGGGLLGVGGATSRGTSVTAIAARAAPPERESVTFPTIALLVFGTLGAFPILHGLWFLAAIFGLVIYQADRYNANEWKRLYEAWDREYLCGRCGEIMVPVASEPKRVAIIADATAFDATAQEVELPG